MKYHAILFDLDGTLVDSMPDIATATNAMLAAIGHRTLPIEQLRTFVGKGTTILIKRAIAANIDPPEPEAIFFAQAQQLFNQYYHLYNGTKSQLYPNVIAGLQQLKKRKLKLGVVTNKPHEFTIPLLEKTGLLPFFEVVVSGDTCTLKKPHPEPLYHACKLLSISIQNTLFVGDSQNDTQAANAANMDVLILPYGYNEGNAIQNLKFNAIVPDIHAIVDWIDNQHSSTMV